MDLAKGDLFVIPDENGDEITYRVLFIEKNNGKDYVVYTDDIKNEFGETGVLASVYVPGEADLMPIETDEEWDFIEGKLDEYQETLTEDDLEEL